MKRLALTLALPALLAGCGSDPEPAPTPSPTPAAVGPRTLVAAGFQEQELGPRIEGPQGTEVESEIGIGGRVIATMVSYVACPAPAEDEIAAEECVPGDQPEGTVYTYVHRVTPAAIEGDDGVAPISFRTARAVVGFANSIGFDRTQAEAALGEDYAIGVQLDSGALVWRIEKGDGWRDGEELTFFWQSTLPPEGPSEAYEIETIAGRALGTGPFPPAEVVEETGDDTAGG